MAAKRAGRLGTVASTLFTSLVAPLVVGLVVATVKKEAAPPAPPAPTWARQPPAPVLPVVPVPVPAGGRPWAVLVGGGSLARAAQARASGLYGSALREARRGDPLGALAGAGEAGLALAGLCVLAPEVPILGEDEDE